MYPQEAARSLDTTYQEAELSAASLDRCIFSAKTCTMMPKRSWWLEEKGDLHEISCSSRLAPADAAVSARSGFPFLANP